MRNYCGSSARIRRCLFLYGLISAFLGCSLLQVRAVSLQSSDLSVEQLWKEASAAQQAQQYSDAAALYKKILTLEPNLMEAEVNLGLMLHLSGDTKAAIDCFRHVLIQHPNLFAANLLTGLDYLKLDNPSEALPYLQRATKEQPDQVEARVGLANSYLQLKQYSEALDNFSRATQLNSKNATAWYGLGATYLSMEKEIEAGLKGSASPFRAALLGQCYLQQGQPDKAIETFRAVVTHSQAVPCARANLGFAYLKESKFDEALRQFKADWDSRSGEGCLLAKLGVAALDAEKSDIEEASRELRETVRLDSAFVQKNAEFYLGDMIKAGIESSAREIIDAHTPDESQHVSSKQADSYARSGHYSWCSSALSEPGLHLSVAELRLLSLCSYYIGRDDLVMSATAQVLKSDPGDAEALYWRIQSTERLGLAALTTATDINPDSASLHALSADLLREKGDLKGATEEYRKAIALKPEFLAAHLGLARVLNSDHNSDAAEYELRYVVDVNADDPQANYLLGEILVNRQNLPEAFPYLVKALQIKSEERFYVHADLSRVYEERGDLVQAIEEMKQALPADVDGSYHYRLGRLYMNNGDHTAAAQALDQSAKLRHQADSEAMFVK